MLSYSPSFDMGHRDSSNSQGEWKDGNWEILEASAVRFNTKSSGVVSSQTENPLQWNNRNIIFNRKTQKNFEWLEKHTSTLATTVFNSSHLQHSTMYYFISSFQQSFYGYRNAAALQYSPAISDPSQRIAELDMSRWPLWFANAEQKHLV